SGMAAFCLTVSSRWPDNSATGVPSGCTAAPLAHGPIANSRRIANARRPNMTRVRWTVFCSAAALWCLSSAPAAKPDSAPEVNWARGIADDFWRSIFAGRSELAAGLLSPGLAKSLVTEQWYGDADSRRVRDLPASHWLGSHL